MSQAGGKVSGMLKIKNLKEDQCGWSSVEKKTMKKQSTQVAESNQNDQSKALKPVKTGKLWSNQWLLIHQKWKLAYN